MKDYPKKPSKLLLNTVYAFVRGSYKKYNITADRSGVEQVEKGSPFILLYNHIGKQDHMLTGYLLRPLLANNMISRWVQYDPIVGPLAEAAGGFFKNRFYPDPQAVVYCKKVLKRGGVVAMAPAGVYSIDGTTHYIDYGTAKLIKLFKVPVVAAKISGAYFYVNGHRKSKLKGKVKIQSRLLFDSKEAQELSEQAIFQKLWEELDFNDFEYRLKEGFLVEGKDLAEGVENILYKCLKCGEEFTLTHIKDDLICSICGNRVTVKNDMNFYPKSQNAAYADRLDKWNLIQKKLLEKEILKDDFCISDKVTLKRNKGTKKRGLYFLGEGVITLNREGITYVGTDGKEKVEYSYPLNRTSNVGFTLGKYLTIERDKNAFLYWFDEPRKISKFVQALVLMRRAFFPNFEGEKEWREAMPNNNLEAVIWGETLCPQLLPFVKNAE